MTLLEFINKDYSSFDECITDATNLQIDMLTEDDLAAVRDAQAQINNPNSQASAYNPGYSMSSFLSQIPSSPMPTTAPVDPNQPAAAPMPQPMPMMYPQMMYQPMPMMYPPMAPAPQPAAPQPATPAPAPDPAQAAPQPPMPDQPQSMNEMDMGGMGASDPNAIPGMDPMAGGGAPGMDPMAGGGMPGGADPMAGGASGMDPMAGGGDMDPMSMGGGDPMAGGEPGMDPMAGGVPGAPADPNAVDPKEKFASLLTQLNKLSGNIDDLSQKINNTSLNNIKSNVSELSAGLTSNIEALKQSQNLANLNDMVEDFIKDVVDRLNKIIDNYKQNKNSIKQ